MIVRLVTSQKTTVNHNNLSETASVRDDVRVQQQAVKQLRVKTGGSTDPIKTQVAYKDVDRLMKRWLPADSDYQRQIDEDCDEVRHQR